MAPPPRIVEQTVPHRVRRFAHSLKRDIGTMGILPPIRFTNVDDATHDHANPRAKCTNAESVFRGTVFHLATAELSHGVSSARFSAAGRLHR
jgi:hypothetical protein